MNIAYKRLGDCVNSLILSNPLFAAILIQQRFEADPNTPTFSVDGEVFRFNPAFADTLTFDECKAVCAHEAMHLALLHHVRMGKRDAEQWNQATDYAINAELKKQGFKLPSGALIDAKYADKSAEDIYRELAHAKKQPQPSQSGNPSNGQQPGQQQSQQGQSSNQQGQPSGQPSNAPGSAFGQVLPASGNPKEAEAKAKGQMEKAMSISRMAGQLPGGLERAIKAAESPRYDWREVLHRFFQEFTARDYSFSTPNKRFAHTGLILPSLRSHDVGRIVLAVDTSGSVSEEEVSAMVAEMQNCMETYSESGLADGLTVIYCDASVQGVETLYSGDKANPKGGGGTRFAPVFDHLANDLGDAACLVYLTDGENGDNPETLAKCAPSYPVLWGLIQDNERFAPPFGEVFRLDIHA